MLNALLDGTEWRGILPLRGAAKVPADRDAVRGLVIGVVLGMAAWLLVIVAVRWWLM
jgi:hypothetical protein